MTDQDNDAATETIETPVAAPAPENHKDAAGQYVTAHIGDKAAEYFSKADGVKKEKALDKFKKALGPEGFWTKVAKHEATHLVGTALFTAWLVHSPAEVKPSMSPLQQLRAQHATEIKNLKAQHDQALKAARNAAASPYSAQRDVIAINGEKLSVPANFLLKKKPAQAETALRTAGKALAITPPLGKYVAWGSAAENINGRTLTFADETMLQDKETREAIVESFTAIKADMPKHLGIRKLSYRFAVEADSATGKKYVVVSADRGSDNIGLVELDTRFEIK